MMKAQRTTATVLHANEEEYAVDVTTDSEYYQETQEKELLSTIKEKTTSLATCFLRNRTICCVCFEIYPIFSKTPMHNGKICFEIGGPPEELHILTEGR